MSAVISASLVKELRDQTGAGMMDCKRALSETDGDIEKAVELLRKWGAASAAKRSGRETPEGKVGYRIADDGKKGTMVAVGSETEPVSNNDEFLAFAKKVLETVEAEGPGSESALEDERVALSGKLAQYPLAVAKDGHAWLLGGSYSSMGPGYPGTWANLG